PEAFLPIRQVGVQFHAASEGVAATEDVFAVLDEAGEGEEASARLRLAQPVSSASLRDSAQRPTPEEGASASLRDSAQRPVGSQLAAADQYRALSERSETKRVERAQRVEAPTLHVQNLQVRDLPPVSFTAAPGTITLVEGPSGSGKSSLIAALRGAAAFTGTATLAGTDVRNLAPADWLAWAGQSPGLIRGTIADNVTLGSDPEPAAIRHALDAACADDLDPAQELGVQGSGLSGGQAQRVAVARALYRHAAWPDRILVLDEPSSALDADTEQRLWTTLRDRADAGGTILLVSHRRTAREIADRVVALGVLA
ncbi:MAG: ATP-binding cassette domain-containing protein, partial [Microbacterium sp.]